MNNSDIRKAVQDLIDKSRKIDIEADKKIKELEAKSAAIDAELNQQLDDFAKRIKS